MHPMQFSSFAVYIGNHPSLLGALRQAKTSTGHTPRQNPHALHMSSPITTSQRPAGPREGFFSGLNSGIGAPRGLLTGTAGGGPEHDRLRAPDVGAAEALGGVGVAGGDGLEDRAVLAVGVPEPRGRPEQQGMKVPD